MSVTMDFFNDISFEIAKQKYYNANKVDAKMVEIKAAVQELLDENERLRAELDEIGTSRERMAQLVLSAQERAERIEDEAKQQAREIVENARAEAESLHSAENAPARAAGLSAAQLEAIDRLNKQLDDFNLAQATQIFRIKQSLMSLALEE